jgi:hypothetical protein
LLVSFSLTLLRWLLLFLYYFRWFISDFTNLFCFNLSWKLFLFYFWFSRHSSLYFLNCSLNLGSFIGRLFLLNNRKLFNFLNFFLRILI